MPRHQDARGCTVEDTCEVKFTTCHINDGVTSNGGFKMSVLPHVLSSRVWLLWKLLQLTRIPSPVITRFSISAYPHPQTIYLHIFSSTKDKYKHFPKQRRSKFRKGDAKNPFSGKTRFDNVFANRDLKSRSIANFMLSLFFWTWRLVSLGLLSTPPLPQKSNKIFCSTSLERWNTYHPSYLTWDTTSLDVSTFCGKCLHHYASFTFHWNGIWRFQIVRLF